MIRSKFLSNAERLTGNIFAAIFIVLPVRFRVLTGFPVALSANALGFSPLGFPITPVIPGKRVREPLAREGGLGAAFAGFDLEPRSLL